MKKLLGISLVAMMAVTTARADIASKAYVDVSGTHPIVSASNTTGANIGALADAIGELPEGKTAAQAIADAVSGSSTALDALNLTAVTGVIKSVSQTKGQVAATAGTIADADVAADANIAQGKIANLTTDLAAKASASDLTAETTARENADTAINTLIGTIPQSATATDVVGYVDEKVAAVAGDVASLGDLASKDEVEESDLASALATKINGKQDKSTIANSLGTADGSWVAAGALATKSEVAKTDLATALADEIDAKATTANLSYQGASGGNVITQVTQANGVVSATMGNAIMETDATGTDGVSVLTRTVSNGVATYKWENIARGN